jgi:hypothetical protein
VLEPPVDPELDGDPAGVDGVDFVAGSDELDDSDVDGADELDDESPPPFDDGTVADDPDRLSVR